MDRIASESLQDINSNLVKIEVYLKDVRVCQAMLDWNADILSCREVVNWVNGELKVVTYYRPGLVG